MVSFTPLDDSVRVILATLTYPQRDSAYELAELTALATADGFETVATVQQNHELGQSRTYFGSGKVTEITALGAETEADLLIINDELTPSQLTHLEKATGLRIFDRTELILDIFAQQAKTKQAKLQVAIAQLQYELPRIHPSANPLDQQRGGGGQHNRGAGETQRELDKRVLKKRITLLKQQLATITAAQTTQSQARRQTNLPKVALVGYTNAGKSTTLNALLALYGSATGTDKTVLVRDGLFATLDTQVRQLHLPDHFSLLMSDTVGFVSRLPHHLVESFYATLSEARHADLLIHVVDSHDPHRDEQIKATEAALAAVGASQIPTLMVLNKADLLPRPWPELLWPDALYYSARDPAGVQYLAEAIKTALQKQAHSVTLHIPVTSGKVIATLTAKGAHFEPDDTGITLNTTLALTDDEVKLYQHFISTD